jgi:hypothetical protein
MFIIKPYIEKEEKFIAATKSYANKEIEMQVR